MTYMVLFLSEPTGPPHQGEHPVRRHGSSALASRSGRMAHGGPVLLRCRSPRTPTPLAIETGDDAFAWCGRAAWAFSFIADSPGRVIVAWRLRPLFSVILTTTDGQKSHGQSTARTRV